MVCTASKIGGFCRFVFLELLFSLTMRFKFVSYREAGTSNERSRFKFLSESLIITKPC